MLSYGKEINSSPVLADAEQIAAETMRRAKANVLTLLARLPEIGYKFKYGFEETPNEIVAYAEPSTDVEEAIRNFEKTIGPIPLSIKAWYRQVGAVWLSVVESLFVR